MHKIISDYFHFTKKERMAIIFFLGLLLLTLIYRIALNFHTNPYLKIEIKNIELPIDSIHKNNKHITTIGADNNHGVAFPIDPNNASFNDFTTIGFSKKQAAIIFNYRKKGGRFNYKEDLLKVYSIDSTSFKKMEKWIALPNKMEAKSDSAIVLKKAPQLVKKRIEINEADSMALLSVYGIGPYLAHQIIRYRDRLGGFITLDQLQEIKGVHSENYTSLITLLYINTPPIKININSTELKTLAIHPYSNWQLATLIINYRTQHGPFKQLSELNGIYGIDETKLSKIKPYLNIE